MSYEEPTIFKDYKMKLAKIISEDLDFWLQRNDGGELTRGFELWVEAVDRYFVYLGPVKNQLLLKKIPTQDTLIRRFREIVNSGEITQLLKQAENQLTIFDEIETNQENKKL